MYKMCTLFETSYIRESETIVVNFVLLCFIKLLENFIWVSSISEEISTHDRCIPINSSQNVTMVFFFFLNSFLFIFSLLNSSILCFTLFPLRIYFSDLIYLTHIWLFFFFVEIFFFHLLYHIWHAIIIMCIIWF